MKKYLVSGATGFIGRRLINFLNTSECQIQIISRHKHNVLETIVCDFEKDVIPESLIDEVDTIFHLAGFTHDIRADNKVKDVFQKVNVDATLQLAKIAIKKGVKNFIFVSSVKAGACDNSELSSLGNGENEPEGVYGRTKKEAELRLLEMIKGSGMKLSIVRPALVYGPKVKGNLSKMLAGIKKGWFPPLPQTNNSRSMIHVDDLVRALVFVAEHKRTNAEVYIATDGLSYSSREIYEVMCCIVGRPVANWAMPKKIFDFLSAISPSMKFKINKLLGDELYSNNKLKSLGFTPQLTIKEMNETSF